MKINKKYLLLRIISFPIKLALQILWGFLFSILISIQWLKHGSQELIYTNDHATSLARLIEQNEKLIKLYDGKSKEQ